MAQEGEDQKIMGVDALDKSLLQEGVHLYRTGRYEVSVALSCFSPEWIHLLSHTLAWVEAGQSLHQIWLPVPGHSNRQNKELRKPLFFRGIENILRQWQLIVNL